MGFLHRHQTIEPFGSGYLVIIDEGREAEARKEVESGCQSGIAGMGISAAAGDDDGGIERMAAQEVFGRPRAGKSVRVVFDDNGREGDIGPL